MLSTPSHHVLAVETSGPSTAAVTSRNPEHLRQLVGYIAYAIENPERDFQVKLDSITISPKNYCSATTSTCTVATATPAWSRTSLRPPAGFQNAHTTAPFRPHPVHLPGAAPRRFRLRTHRAAGKGRGLDLSGIRC
jgi:hypothetical protein